MKKLVPCISTILGIILSVVLWANVDPRPIEVKNSNIKYYSTSFDVSSAVHKETPTITPTIAPVNPSKTLLLPSGSDGTFKAIERVEKITRKDSKQYALRQIYTVDSDGCCRVGIYYAVAMGTYYAKYIGQTLTIELESRTIQVIIGDVKADEDTIGTMYCKTNKSIVEFIVKEGATDGAKINQLMWGKVISIKNND